MDHIRRHLKEERIGNRFRAYIHLQILSDIYLRLYPPIKLPWHHKLYVNQNMAIQLQWSLDKTIGSTLSIARGIFLAANNDNVQPLAIVSCEKFGNTIAMCQDICRKIENLTAKTPEPVAIKFLRVYAGFDAADSASQLSKSQAGVQFLGLAAALVTSMEGYRAGASLHKMLESSASDKTLLPTTRQLKDLLLSLEPRLVRSGFLNTVIGWQSFLTQSSAIPQGISRQSCDYPGLKGDQPHSQCF